MKMHHKMTNALRILSVDMIEQAGSGHPGMPLGMADIASVLWQKFLKFDASHPQWFDRDRLILSNGHGSALLYSLLYLTGFRQASLKELKNFRQFGSRTAGHPERNLLDGVDFSTGPLGQGLAGAVGMALAERLMNARFGDLLVDHKTYAFVGDGCLMEGISEEAIALAGHWRLNKLIVLWDNNHMTIDGTTNLASSTDIKKRFEANGWSVLSCDGHRSTSIEKALEKALTATKPTLIACTTTIGFGAPTKAGTPKAHGSPLGKEECAGLRRQLGWEAPPFEMPEDILSAWRAVGAKGEGARQQWEERLAHSPQKKAFLDRLSSKISTTAVHALNDLKKELLQTRKPIATRKASQQVLETLVPLIPQLIGGSADLSAASFTDTSASSGISKSNYAGNYVNYGIREHAMAGIMNGLAAHGGLIPYAGTFLSFVDYLKPALRLAALMSLQEIYVLTHDSIGVGEDGPTHQPIEQLASLRATPNVLLFRPADSIETVESYAIALKHTQGPSVLALSRQELPVVRTDSDGTHNKTSLGGYVLSEPSGKRDITLIATGSEVSLAVRAQALLAEQGMAAAVVSLPCTQLFEAQPLSYRQAVLGDAPRLIIEAGASFGWDRYLGVSGAILGVDTFGASGKSKDVLQAFGFTPENIVLLAQELIRRGD